MASHLFSSLTSMQSFPIKKGQNARSNDPDFRYSSTIDGSTIARQSDKLEGNQFVRPALERLINDTIGKGIKIDISAFQKEIILSAISMDDIRNMFDPISIKLLIHLYTVGLAFVAFVKDSDDKGRLHPKVQEFKWIDIRVTETPTTLRKYQVFAKDTGESMEGILIVRYPPTTDGVLTAPLGLIAELADLAKASRTWRMRAEFQLSHTPWVYGSQEMKNKPDPMAEDEWTRGEVANRWEEQRLEAERVQREQMEKLRREWQRVHEQMMKDMGTSSVSAEITAPPWLYHTSLPYGKTLAGPGPMPSPSDFYQALEESLKTYIHNSLGIPPFLMSGEAAKVKSQTDQAERDYYLSVERYQMQLASVLKTTFLKAREEDFMRIVVGIHTSAKKRAKEMLDEAKDVEVTREMMDDIEQEVDKANKKQEKEQGTTMLKASPEELKRAGKIFAMKDSELAGVVLSLINFTISFDAPKYFNQEKVEKLNADGAIRLSDYHSILASQAGIPPDMLLVGDERVEELKRRKEELVDVVGDDMLGMGDMEEVMGRASTGGSTQTKVLTSGKKRSSSESKPAAKKTKSDDKKD